ncbi:MAG: hypothetical protein K2X57_00620 [Xanthobacteraceae bacterium]|nr:hypothetical protein [Xanthobacteraceae bacterium]
MEWLTDAKFADAIKKDLPWIEVAHRFGEGLTQAAQGGEAARTRYQKDAARFTGYSIGMLRNLAATLQWMRTSKSHLHLPEEVVLKSFTALDLIRRLDVYHPGKADYFLSRLGTATGVRVSALRAELRSIARDRDRARRPTDDVAKPVVAEEIELVEAEPRQMLLAARPVRPSLAQMRSWRSMSAMDDIAKLLPILSGEVHHFGRPEGVAPIGIRATAIAWLDADMTEGDAFEIVNAGHGLSRSTLSDHVSRAIASSRFFRRHFLAFTSDSEPDMVYRTKESLEMLKIPAVGVVWFGHTGKDAILLMPKDSPTPDCRHRLKEICKLGHWQ